MKVAVVGLGWWGKQIVSCLDKSPQFEVLYGVDPTPPPDIEAFRQLHGFKLETELGVPLADSAVDGVILATPHAVHEEQAIRVIAAGKNLFCEKPLTMTGAGAERIVKACRDAGKVLGIGHERRYEPAFEEVQRLVKEKALGKLLLMEANLSHDLFRKLAPSSWRLSSTHAPAGLMTALGIHLTDLFVHLAGEAQDVHAWTGRMVLDPPAEDFMTASIAFASGVRASITSLSVTPFYSRVTFYGDQGWVEVAAEANVDQGKPTLLTHASGSERRSATFEATDTVTENFEAWADAVEGRAPYRFSDQELIGNIKILEAIVTSSRENGAAQRL